MPVENANLIPGLAIHLESRRAHDATLLIVAYIVATPALVLVSACEGQVISAGDATVLVSVGVLPAAGNPVRPVPVVEPPERVWRLTAVAVVSVVEPGTRELEGNARESEDEVESIALNEPEHGTSDASEKANNEQRCGPWRSQW